MLIGQWSQPLIRRMEIRGGVETKSLPASDSLDVTKIFDYMFCGCLFFI